MPPGSAAQAGANPILVNVAVALVSLVNPQTHGGMRRALVSAFAGATSFAMARAVCPHVVEVADFTEDEKELLRKACTENSRIARAYGVANAISTAFGSPRPPEEPQADDVPF
jgi:hypothetical protein